MFASATSYNCLQYSAEYRLERDGSKNSSAEITESLFLNEIAQLGELRMMKLKIEESGRLRVGELNELKIRELEKLRIERIKKKKTLKVIKRIKCQRVGGLEKIKNYRVKECRN